MTNKMRVSITVGIHDSSNVFFLYAAVASVHRSRVVRAAYYFLRIIRIEVFKSDHKILSRQHLNLLYIDFT